ncbi:MAG: hypothetical protein A3C35_07485 [Omnitrophica bacterium RIFCSPHIGHO2_02_FULL_46_11]|nr:MAG: hypothetical protein A3C35_07485 [Omnitrophica bacterium RIFCSPHIGHO2_02_FULL_46_11]OGW86780.1 MAG: hypothetical protein A3A81_08955 [Omnitrophica bacterium RIFCSPLOWO2_01_FULL_45_10b]
MGCWLSLIITIVCSLFLMMGNASSSEQNSAETPDLSEPHQSSSVSMLTRLNSGFINIATGPLELVNQPRQEIKRTNFLFGVVPGVVKGVAWFGIREGVGISEIATFPSHQKPLLEPIDTDWLSL